MITSEFPNDNIWTEGTSRVEGTAGVVCAEHLSDEECQSNANGCNEVSCMFLGRQHEDGEDKLGREEHLLKSEYTAQDEGAEDIPR